MTSNGLALYTPQEQVQLAADVWPMANRLSGTDFVPAAMRGKPEAVMACMVKGAELGIPLMQSLAQIHVIDGRPTMAAELMRAVVFARGHQFVVDDSNTTSCTVSVKRAGGERWHKFTRTMDDAKRAGLDGKQNWRKYPADMLLARVTGVACRAVFPDVLGGISYTMEELTDGDVVDLGGPGATTEGIPGAKPATARARRNATRGAAPSADVAETEPPPRPAAERPPLPGEEDDIIDAEVVPETAPPAPAPAPMNVEMTEADPFDEYVDDDPAIDDPDPADDQREEGRGLSWPAQIAIQMQAHGVSDRNDKLAACEMIVGHGVDSSKDLTAVEVGMVLAFLAALDDGAPFPFQDVEPGQPDPPPAEETPTPIPASAPAPAQRRPSSMPDAWTADEWRAFLAKRKVKLGPALVEARRLAGDAGQLPPATIDEIAGLGIGDDLVGWVEDQTR